MQKNMFRKGIVLGIIVLFIGASVTPSISGNIKQITTTIIGSRDYIRYDDFDDYNVSESPKPERGWTTSGLTQNQYVEACIDPLDPDNMVMKIHGSSLDPDKYCSLRQIYFGPPGSYVIHYRIYSPDLSMQATIYEDFSEHDTSGMANIHRNTARIAWFEGALPIVHEFDPPIDASTTNWIEEEFTITADEVHLFHDDSIDTVGGFRSPVEIGIESWDIQAFRLATQDFYIDDFWITDYNRPPVANIDLIFPNPAEIGEEILFSASVSDPDNDDIVEYFWRSNIDGKISDTEDFTKSDLSDGLHEISFKAKDEHGAWSDWKYKQLEVIDGLIFRPSEGPGSNDYTIADNPLSGWGLHDEDAHADLTDGAVAVASESGILGSSSATAKLGINYFYTSGGKKTLKVSSNLLSVGGKTGWASSDLMLQYQRGSYQYWNPGSSEPVDKLFDWDLIIDLFIFYAILLCPPGWAGLIASNFLNIVGAWRTIEGYQNLYEILENEDDTEVHKVSFECEVLPYFNNYFTVELQTGATSFIVGGKVARSGQIPYICIEEVETARRLSPLEGELSVYGYGPINLTITDSAGRLLNCTYSEIPGSEYTNFDFNYDAYMDNYFFIPNAINGAYNISVTPKDWADPNATFSIIVDFESEQTVLIENETILNASSYNYNVFSMNPPLVQFSYPKGYETLNQTVTIEWIADDYEDGDDLPISLYYSDDNGDHWYRLTDEILENTGEYEWDTQSLPDGTYSLMIETVDSDDNLRQDYSNDFIIHNYEIPVENQPPNISAKPTGPINGKPGIEYTYTVNTTDPDGDQLFYLFYWGDGDRSGWLGPFDSGETCEASYAWSEKGTYEIKVRASDIYGAKSNWSDPLSVTMPRNKAVNFNFNLLEQLFKRFSNAFPILRYILGFQ